MNQINQNKIPNNYKRLLRAFYCSTSGLKTAFKDNASLRQECLLGILVIPLALTLEASVVEKILLIGSWLFVLIVEVMNSSIELIVDRISLEIHPLSKKIKDMGSAGVLLSIINMIFIWVIVVINIYL